ncbi:coiled-coil domain-containing protein [Levilactobacillus brevis]|uniref:coiled-coil domain-containing protein n=1 Tax=Levilactobacillus brevis TaxID=1580 RepID=UPI0004659048|nr:hypothetical protein [Levilactobacillus brevis]ARN93995.1 hypothetical protein AZI11_13780 [Levilactobacillus brevis]ARN96569.1 hypothetical protein AZI12_13860 [Levilactobacillus brevis]
MPVDGEIKKKVDELLDSIGIVNEKKEKLQLTINSEINEIRNERGLFGKKVAQLEATKKAKIDTIKKYQEGKNNLEDQIQKKVTELNVIQQHEKQVSKKIEALRQDVERSGADKQKQKSDLAEMTKSIREIDYQEGQLAETIKNASSLADIIKTTQKYKTDIDVLQNRKSDLLDKIDQQHQLIATQESKIGDIEAVIADQNKLYGQVKASIQETKGYITQLSDELSTKITKINLEKDNLTKIDSDVSETTQQAVLAEHKTKQILTIQDRFLTYPKFSKVLDYIKGKKMLVSGSPATYPSLIKNGQLGKLMMFYRVQKPDFHSAIDKNEISPFFCDGFSTEKKSSTPMLDTLKEEYTVKVPQKFIYEFYNKEDQLRVKVKLRNDASIWQTLYYSTNANKQQQITKINVYDMFGNLRYTEYPSYSGEEIVGRQVHWFSAKGAVFLINQSFNDIEQFQMISEESEAADASVDEITVGINALFAAWLNRIVDKYVIVADLNNTKIVDKVNSSEMVAYAGQYQEKLPETIEKSNNKFKALLFNDVADAKIAYWKIREPELIIL